MQSSKILSRERVLEELVKGRRLANQLKIHLDKPFQNDGSISKENLSEKILDSFRKALSFLSNHDSDHLHGPSSSHPTVINHHRVLPDSTHSDFSKSENLGNQRKTSRKRKITSKAEIVEREEPFELMDDGYMWRKYGQKKIQRHKHPRSYFRCTYSEKGCEALKHVQQISKNPPIYKTTCFGRHTCDNSPNKDSGFVSDYDLPSNMIRFDKFVDMEMKNDVVEKAQGGVRDEGGYSVEELWPSDDFPRVDYTFDLGVIEFDLDDDQFWIGERVLTNNLFVCESEGSDAGRRMLDAGR